jgi:hypothetical protein
MPWNINVVVIKRVAEEAIETSQKVPHGFTFSRPLAHVWCRTSSVSKDVVYERFAIHVDDSVALLAERTAHVYQSLLEYDERFTNR